MRLISIGLLYFFSVGFAVYAATAYLYFPLGSLVHPDMKSNFEAHSAGIYSHIFSSTVALAIGPFQFSARFRKRYPSMHRRLGQAYLGIGILIGGFSGLYMSMFAYGGLIAKSGFGLLAILWLYTGLNAYLAIRRGDVTAHKTWMVRNFSLTLAAVTLRLYLSASVVADIEFSLAYATIAWLCWVPNLMFAEWRYNNFAQ